MKCFLFYSYTQLLSLKAGIPLLIVILTLRGEGTAKVFRITRALFSQNFQMVWSLRA